MKFHNQPADLDICCYLEFQATMYGRKTNETVFDGIMSIQTGKPIFVGVIFLKKKLLAYVIESE